MLLALWLSNSKESITRWYLCQLILFWQSIFRECTNINDLSLKFYCDKCHFSFGSVCGSIIKKRFNILTAHVKVWPSHIKMILHYFSPAKINLQLLQETNLFWDGRKCLVYFRNIFAAICVSSDLLNRVALRQNSLPG